MKRTTITVVMRSEGKYRQVEVKGYEFNFKTIDGFEYKPVIHRPVNNPTGWTISEKTTGASIYTAGKVSRAECIKMAEHRLNKVTPNLIKKSKAYIDKLEITGSDTNEDI